MMPSMRTLSAPVVAAGAPGHRVSQAERLRLPLRSCRGMGLGILPMLRADAVITSSDPLTGEPVTVTFRGARASWDPRGAVVFDGCASCDGPAEQVSCGYLNFFASRGPRESGPASTPRSPAPSLARPAPRPSAPGHSARCSATAPDRSQPGPGTGGDRLAAVLTGPPARVLAALGLQPTQD